MRLTRPQAKLFNQVKRGDAPAAAKLYQIDQSLNVKGFGLVGISPKLSVLSHRHGFLFQFGRKDVEAAPKLLWKVFLDFNQQFRLGAGAGGFPQTQEVCRVCVCLILKLCLLRYLHSCLIRCGLPGLARHRNGSLRIRGC